MKIERIECPRFSEAMDAQRDAERKRKKNTSPDIRSLFDRESQKRELLARSYEGWLSRMAKGVLAAIGEREPRRPFREPIPPSNERAKHEAGVLLFPEVAETAAKLRAQIAEALRSVASYERLAARKRDYYGQLIPKRGESFAYAAHGADAEYYAREAERERHRSVRLARQLEDLERAAILAKPNDADGLEESREDLGGDGQ